MSFKDCIDEALDEGTITQEQADEMRRRYDGAFAENARTMSSDEAAAQASRDAFDSTEYELVLRKRRLIKQHETQGARLQEVLDIDGKYVGEGVSHILDRDGSGRYKHRDLDSRRTSYVARAHARMAGAISKMRRTGILGRQRRGSEALNNDLVKEIFNVDSGNATAKDFAKAWIETADMLRQAFNKAGGAIPKRSDWGMPQQHDRRLIRQAGFEEWRKYIEDQLDWSRIISERTGRVIPEAERGKFLEEVYATILTSGMNKVKETSVAGKGRSLARRRADHRFLVFENPEAWLAYQQKYGQGDPFTIMMNHIETMSRDIALLETLGPNPNSTISFLKTQLQKRAAEADLTDEKGKNASRLSREIKSLDEIYGDVSGSSYIPVNETMAKGFASLGELLVSAQLGAAAISAIFGDAATTRITKRIAGMPHAGVMTKSLKTLLASNPTKQELIRAGLIAENWSSVAFGQARYMGDLMGAVNTQRVSNFVMNVSGLSPITQAERWAFGQSTMGFFSDQAAKTFDQLAPDVQRLLRTYDIEADDWNAIRKTKKYTYKRGEWLRPTDVFEANELSGQKYLDLIQMETDRAVPVSGPRARAAALGKEPPGTIRGDLWRSIAQYKTFPIVLFQNNLKQFRYLEASKMSRIGYATEFFVHATVMGGIALQIREVLKGRDPMAMFGEDGEPNLPFWGKAMLAGGSLSLFGDFLFADHNRFGHSLGETIAGPRVSFIGDVLRLTVGNVEEVIEGKDTNFALEAVNFAGRYGPGTSISYLRLGLERLVLDNLRMMADPDYERRFRRKAKGLERRTGQELWWKPGEQLPSRAPDIEAIARDLPE
jgi:hypothetical protein